MRMMTSRIHFLIFTLCLCFVLNNGKAEILLKNDPGKQMLKAGEVEWFMDTTHKSAMEVLQYFDNGGKSNINNPEYDNINNINATYWMLMAFENQSIYQDWIIELHDPHVGKIWMYRIEDNKPVEFAASGFLFPFETRKIAHKNHLFYVSMPTKEHCKFLVKVESPYFIKMYSSILPASKQIGSFIFEYWFLGLYYGSLLVLSFYNLVVFFYSRKSVYLWYVAYTVSCIFSGLREDGLGFQYFWPDLPWVNLYHFQAAHLLLLYSFVFFSLSFLEIPFLKGKRGRVMVWLMIVYTFTFFVEDYLFKYWKLGSYLYIVPFVLLVYYAVELVLKKNKSARLYLIGFTMLIVGVFSFILRVNDFIPHNFFTVYIFNFSIFTEVIIMSLALAYQYKDKNDALVKSQKVQLDLVRENEAMQQTLVEELALKNALKESINQELEKKVAEKTQSLSLKNQELEAANQKLDFYAKKLESFGAQLDKENWELNKKVKQSLFDKISGKGADFNQFLELYPTNDACLKYVSELKWAKGFVCRSCGNTKFTAGEIPFSKKCTKCTKRETALAHTLFHGIKFDITKALYIAYSVYDGHNDLQAKAMNEQIQLRAATYYGFRKKAEEQLKYIQEKLGKSMNWELFILEG